MGSDSETETYGDSASSCGEDVVKIEYDVESHTLTITPGPDYERHAFRGEYFATDTVMKAVEQYVATIKVLKVDGVDFQWNRLVKVLRQATQLNELILCNCEGEDWRMYRFTDFLRTAGAPGVVPPLRKVHLTMRAQMLVDHFTRAVIGFQGDELRMEWNPDEHLLCHWTECEQEVATLDDLHEAIGQSCVGILSIVFPREFRVNGHPKDVGGKLFPMEYNRKTLLRSLDTTQVKTLQLYCDAELRDLLSVYDKRKVEQTLDGSTLTLKFIDLPTRKRSRSPSP